ncbi:GAF domain-containing protein [Nannocystis sp. ILAH1]|uniref:GAF domain-containing protein n=1 Tax=unclassified Nannocystis TaxID=2627009 RepID=UPI002270A89F|nr:MULTISPECIES: GAF domain-containing protein [unclassified Nannocystis]MCY0986036.1 GAF domain-containing protein [Nannocystis sp. ILAH1]MCY1068632.1 GAF domain-containing protein [Nannocystis sp. RBIL2]
MRAQDAGQGDLHDKTRAALHEFFGRGEAFVRQLIAENERLRSELNEAQPDRPARPELTPGSVMEGLIGRIVELEKARAGEPGAPAGAETRLRERLVQLEDENYHLASMYVAGLQFHASRTIGDVLQTTTEILLNFIGVGAFTLYLVDEERRVLFPIAREGGEMNELVELEMDEASPAAQMVQRGRPWSRGDPAYASDDVIMYLPLVSGRRLVAVLRLEAFLAQKPGFEDNDYSLLSMISEHAGIAIESAWIRAHAKAVALQRQAVEHLLGA